MQTIANTSRPTAAAGAMMIVLAALALELIGAGAYVAASLRIDPTDFCYLAICQ